MLNTKILAALVVVQLRYVYSNYLLCPFPQEVMDRKEHFCGRKLLEELAIVCNGTNNLNKTNVPLTTDYWRLVTTEETPSGKFPPDACNTSYDAVALIQREVFIFKDSYFWRIGDSGPLPGYPVEINRLWRGFPSNLTHVDSVYERPDKKIAFFVDDHYYVFSGINVERGYPVWGHNGKTFFYSGDMYWRFIEDDQKVELGYPRNILMWRGIGTDIDAVFQWKDGKTYFFKDKGFWKFNDLHMSIEHASQKQSASIWMRCAENNEEKHLVNDRREDITPNPAFLANKTEDIQPNARNVGSKTNGYGNGISESTKSFIPNRPRRTPSGITAECCIRRCSRRHLSLYCLKDPCSSNNRV